jgi:hypothetical protein
VREGGEERESVGVGAEPKRQLLDCQWYACHDARERERAEQKWLVECLI